MDAETALKFVKYGSTLLLLDVPQHTLVGIDTEIFSVGPDFKGIKMIPPGTHFVYYSSSNRQANEFSPISGFFIDTISSEVVARKWNQDKEQLDKLSEEEATKDLEFDKYLGPYALNSYVKWKRLSNYITKSIIERIEPIGGEISVDCESPMIDGLPKTSMDKTLDKQLKNSMFSRSIHNSQRKRCFYTPIPHVIKGTSLRGHELTSLNLDKTALLESILMKDYGGSDDLLLGELQFAFIAFLMGQSLEAFIQWKSLVTLFFSCIEAPFHTRSQLFSKFVKVIYYQLKYGLGKDPSDAGSASSMLYDFWITTDNFLHNLCKDFFYLVHEASFLDGDLLTWSRRLGELLKNSLGWDFRDCGLVDGLYSDAGDEFAPVVVALDEES